MADFNIEVVFSGDPSVLPYVEEAVRFWELVIVGDVNGTNDLVINVSVQPIDGAGNTLAEATFTATHTSGLPSAGFVNIDTADTGSMIASGNFTDVIIHEIGHVLGLSSLWEVAGLVVFDGLQYRYSSPPPLSSVALDEYRILTNNASAAFIPVESSAGDAGSDGVHWAEIALGAENATPFLAPGRMPVSRVTIGSLADLGYTVDLGAADVFSVSATPGDAIDDYAGNYSTTDKLAIGASVLGAVEQSFDNDWVELVLQQGTSYSFQISGIPLHTFTALANPLLSLRDATGGLLASSASPGPTPIGRIDFTPTTTGIYYLDASAIDSGTGGYEITSNGTYAISGAPAAGETGVLTFTVSRNFSDKSEAVAFTLGGSAASGVDYVAPPLSLTFRPGEIEKTIAIQTRFDTLAEGSETVIVSLDPTSVAVDPNAGSATGTIRNLAAVTNASQTVTGDSGTIGGTGGGSGTAGLPANGLFTNAVPAGTAGDDNLSITLAATGGAGGGGGRGLGGVAAPINTVVDVDTSDPVLRITTVTVRNAGPAQPGGNGGAGAPGGEAVSSVESIQVSAATGYDVVNIAARATGGLGGPGGPGGSGGSGNYNSAERIERRTDFALDNIDVRNVNGGSGGSPGASGSSAAGGNAASNVATNTVDLGDGGGTLSLASNATGGAGGSGAEGTATGSSNTLVSSTAGADGAKGGDATARIEGNSIESAGIADEVTTVTLVATATGGRGGNGGSGQRAGFEERTIDALYTGEFVADNQVRYEEIRRFTQGTSSPGGNGAAGGNALAEITGNDFQGGEGDEEVTLQAIALPGVPGQGGVSPETTPPGSETIPNGPNGTIKFIIGGGGAGANGLAGTPGSAEIRITGNTIDGGGGFDGINLKASAPSQSSNFTFTISGNTFIGGADRDSLDLSALSLGQGVNVSLDTGIFSIAGQSNTVSGIEQVTGTPFDDVLAGNGEYNVLRGGNGDNTLQGDAGDDFLLSDSTDGTDELTGGAGNDYIFDITAGGRSIAIWSGARDDYDITVLGDEITVRHARNNTLLDEGVDVVGVDELRFSNGSFNREDFLAERLSVALSPSTVDEGGVVTLTVSREGDIGAATTVDYEITGAAANTGDIAIAITGKITIPAGQASASRTVFTLDDSVTEALEAFTASISDPTSGSIAAGAATAVIIDDDGGTGTAPIVSVALAPASVTEGGAFTLTVSRSVALSGAATTVDYVIAPGPGSAGFNAADIGLPLTGTIVIPAGAIDATLTIATPDDIDVEGNESFTVTLSNPTNGTFVTGQPRTAVGTILDNDLPPPVISVFAILPGTGMLDEGETFTLELTRTGDLSRVSSVIYDLTPLPGFFDFDAADVAIPLTGTITFAAGQATMQLAIPTVDDAIVELDENFVATISGAVNATLGNIADFATIINNDVANRAPFADDEKLVTAEDTPLSIAVPGVLDGDTDADGDPLTAALVSGPANGTLSLNADGSFVYTPSGNFNGTDSFTYRASDGTAVSNVATVTIDVTPVNDVPVAASDSYTVAENATLGVSGPGLLDGDTDADGDPLTAALVSGPANGTLSLNADGSFVYTPSGNFNGTDSFTYRASDGTAVSNVATVTIVVTPVNDVPVAASDSYTIAQGGVLSVAGPGVLAGDSDPDGDALSAVLANAPANGTLTLNADGSFTYAPNSGFSGSDSFTYRANDGTAASNVATVAITVTAAGGFNLINGTSSGGTTNGTAGADLITPAGGADFVFAGTGNDVIRATIDDGTDTYFGGGGRDTVDYSALTQGVNVNLLSLFGFGAGIATGAQTGTDLLASIENIVGSQAADTIRGNGSANMLEGNAGNDTVAGGGGSDTFVFKPGFGNDVITDFDAVRNGGAATQDYIELSENGITAANFAQHVEISDIGADTLIVIDADPSQTIRLVGIANAASITVDDFRFV